MHVLSFNQFPSVYAPRLGLSIILCLTELQQMLNCPICKLSMQEQYFASHRSSSQRNQTIVIIMYCCGFFLFNIGVRTWGLLQDDRPSVYMSRFSSQSYRGRANNLSLAQRQKGYTTGLSGFVECQGHLAKPNLHSAKALPSAALGKGHSAKNGPAKVSLPSVFCRALGKAFAECLTLAKLEPKKNPKNGNFF